MRGKGSFSFIVYLLFVLFVSQGISRVQVPLILTKEDVIY